MVHYADTSGCRRRELLAYFGEQFEEETCGGCDNCSSPRETYDGTLLAQKFVSCVYRIRQQSGFDFGMNQVVEVLTGVDTERLRKYNHHLLSTYGIGKEHTRPEWKTIGRELIRLGYLRQAPEQFNVLSVTAEGMAMLRERKKVTLTKAVTSREPKKSRIGDIACDEVLFERLRQLRKQLADERNVPSYIVFSDVTLRQMAREYPCNELEFARLSGVGERKLRDFGSAFLQEIAVHLQSNSKQMFAEDSFNGSSNRRSRR
jgi:ATP-dependent DNA helicase RecQ